ncbi:MAG: hypothetical protein IJT30_11450 [Muribaculaceae bacterium]|nr:hypothetical protein [Muribaculaceae bacterium]
MKHFSNLILHSLAAAVMLWAPLCAQAQKSKSTAYDGREWLSNNAEALRQLRTGNVGTPVAFKPCAISNDFMAAKCKVVEYYGCAVYYDMERKTVIFVDDAARADYFVIFADVTNVNMGGEQDELYIECNASPTKAFDVLYNVRTNKARKVGEADMAIMGRFATRVPHTYYKTPRDKDTKLLHDYFKALAQGDYVAAQAERRKIIERAGGTGDKMPWENTFIFDSYPLIELGEAMMMSYPSKYANRNELTLPRDPFKGYDYVKQIYRRDTLLNDANAVLLSGDIRLSVDVIKKNIETELLNYARWEGTEAAYDKVLMTLYNSPLRKDARAEQERMVYMRVATSNNADDLLAYLNKFSGAEESHYTQVEQRYFKLAYEQMPPTVAGCRKYLQRCSLSPYAAEVRNKLSEYAFKELQPNTASYKAFLKEFPKSPHCTEVWYRLYESAFNELGDNLEQCQRYLAEYPESEYCDQVVDKIMDIKYAETVKAGTIEAYNTFLNSTPRNRHTDEAMSRLETLRAGGYVSTTVTTTATGGEPAGANAGAGQQHTTRVDVDTHTQQQPAQQQSAPKQQNKQPTKQQTKQPAGTNNNSGNSNLWDLDF